MDTAPSIIPIIASALAAIIAGSVAYVVAVLSKEQKTSEFRQAWIDALRADISDFIAGRTEIALAVAAKLKYNADKRDILNFVFEQFPDFVATKASYHKVLLRLNPIEHKDLILSLAKLDEISPLAADEELVSTAATEVTKQAQLVLKAEWNRVKEGEAVFRWTKRIAVSIVILAALTFVAAVGLHLSEAIAA